MDAWRGVMNWPLDYEWVCELCGERALIWGFVHGICRCDYCHTQYMMRDADGRILDTPAWLMKEEYKGPAGIGWRTRKTPMDTWTDDDWDLFFELFDEMLTQGEYCE